MFETLEDEIQQHIEDVYGQAQSLINDYWDEHRRRRRGRPSNERGKLWPRARLRDGDLVIEWSQEVRQQRAAKQIRSKSIKKGTRYPYRYQLTTLKQYAQPWELDLVEDIENQFALLRERVRKLVLMRMALNNFLRCVEAQSEGSID